MLLLHLSDKKFIAHYGATYIRSLAVCCMGSTNTNSIHQWDTPCNWLFDIIASHYWIKIEFGYQQMHRGPFIAVYNQANRIYFEKMMPKIVKQDFAFFSIYFCNCSSLWAIEFLQKTQYAPRDKIKPVLGTESRVWLIISYPGIHDNEQISMGTQSSLDTKPRKVL